MSLSPPNLSHPRHYTEENWHRASSGASLRNFVLGISDGLVTVMAFVAGYAAKTTSTGDIINGGLAEMFAGATAMGLGAFLGGKAERDLYNKERAREEREILEVPELEKEELREIYRAKGFEGENLEMVIQTLTADPKRWVDVMMFEELGMQRPSGSPLQAGLIVGLSYIIAAAIPLLPYFIFRHAHWAFALSLGITSIALIGVGLAKAHYTQRPLLRSAFETWLMGMAGTAFCYGIGKFLKVH